MRAFKAGEGVGGGASDRVDVVDNRREISIRDLLVWAIRDQQVMAWIDAEHERVGGFKSQLGALVRNLELGASVDVFGGISGSRMPDDAMRVGFVVAGLGRDDRLLVIDCALHDQTPYRPTRQWQHVNDQGLVVKPKFDVDGKRKTVYLGWRVVGGKNTKVRLKVCRIAPVNSDASHRNFDEQYRRWESELELLTMQLSDLKGFKII